MLRIVALGLLAASLACAAISDAACESVAPARYRIRYTASAGPVRIYASHSPDTVDSRQPVATALKSPIEITLPDFVGRPYFHLQDASGGKRVVAVRRLLLDGQVNFRDLGGYRTGDGRYVRWGRLYRSGQLGALTAKDWESLQSLGIRLICDFRSDPERNRQPSQPPAGGPDLMAAPIGEDDQGREFDFDKFPKLIASGGTPAQIRALMTEIYQKFPRRASARYAAMFQRLLATDSPVVWHCTSGKDRTGMFSAFVLMILGVPQDVARLDYLLSNDYVMPKQFAPALAPMLGVEAGYFQATLEAINAQYGSFDAYRRSALKLSDEDVQRLQDKYLVK